MRHALLLALALLCGIAPEVLPFTERSAPERGKGSCDCTPKCVCGCKQGKPCSCEIYPGPRPYPQFPAAGECEANRAEAQAAAEEVTAAMATEAGYNETLGALRTARHEVAWLWQQVGDLQHPETSRECRERLAETLAEQLGAEAFTNGWLPPPR